MTSSDLSPQEKTSLLADLLEKRIKCPFCKGKHMKCFLCKGSGVIKESEYEIYKQSNLRYEKNKWSELGDKIVMDDEMSDEEKADRLKRSVKSVVRRRKLLERSDQDAQRKRFEYKPRRSQYCSKKFVELVRKRPELRSCPRPDRKDGTDK